MSNQPLHVAVVMGTRPEAIKLAPVVHALRQAPGIRCTVVSTGQHHEMLAPVLDFFGIVPDHDLALMQPAQPLNVFIGRALLALDPLLAGLNPDWVVVQGDSATVLAGALAASLRRIPVAHVEAGLRSYDRNAPFPEEILRVLTSHSATLHFVPTAAAAAHLQQEGITKQLHQVGNTVVDALALALDRLTVNALQPAPDDGLLPLDARVVLVTCHRRENFGEPFQRICAAIHQLAKQHPEVHVVYPVHLNPSVQQAAHAALGHLANVHLLPPQPYEAFVWWMQRAHIILTDSGGIQEEAPTLRKPVLVLREVTERPEAVAMGAAQLVGTQTEAIVTAASRLLTDPAAYAAMQASHNPFGDGLASQRIVAELQRAAQPRP